MPYTGLLMLQLSKTLPSTRHCHKASAFVCMTGQLTCRALGLPAEAVHTTGNEVSAITVMAHRGTSDIYAVARLKEVAEWEIALNSEGRSPRWLRQLRPYIPGMLLHSWWPSKPCALATQSLQCLLGLADHTHLKP